MSLSDGLQAGASVGASVSMRPDVADGLIPKGVFVVECFDGDGNLKWRDEFRNAVVDTGVDAMLDDALAGSAYTVTGPFMGLISSVGYSAIANSDTMASHPGWTEAGSTNAPTYSGTRKTCAWNAASARSKALSAALSFAITGAGTLKGAFIAFGAGAVNTIGSTTGTLFSAGLFTTGDRAVQANDTINVSYSITLT